MILDRAYLCFTLSKPQFENLKQALVSKLFACSYCWQETCLSFSPVTKLRITACRSHIRGLAYQKLAKFVNESSLTPLEKPEQRSYQNSLSMQKLLQVHLLGKPWSWFHHHLLVLAVLGVVSTALTAYAEVSATRNALARQKIALYFLKKWINGSLWCASLDIFIRALVQRIKIFFKLGPFIAEEACHKSGLECETPYWFHNGAAHVKQNI